MSHRKKQKKGAMEQPAKNQPAMEQAAMEESQRKETWAASRSALRQEDLMELLICNVEHARHVENERLSFNSIYIAVVAGFFALAFDFNKPLLTIFFIGILLIISLLGLLFTQRWTDVFEEHMAKAQQLALLLYGQEQPDAHEPIDNKYYYFHHDYRRHLILAHIKQEAAKKRVLTYDQAEQEINWERGLPGLWHKLSQIHTRQLFFCFYYIVIGVLALFFLYSIAQMIWGL